MQALIKKFNGINMKILKAIFILLSIQLVVSCTSSTYGNSFIPLQTNEAVSKNRYTLKVYTGGFAGPEYAKKDLDLAANNFIKNNPRYVSYKIISQKFELIPSGVTFVVEFIEKS